MTRSDAEALQARRRMERPGYDWTIQPRGAADWAVLRLPARVGHVDPSSVEAHEGEPEELADDPRPAIFRNLPPYAAGG